MTAPQEPKPQVSPPAAKSRIDRILGWIETVGNKLPDPAMLFFLLMLAVWVLSAFLAPVTFGYQHPQTGEGIRVVNQLAPTELARFLMRMVGEFTAFAPLGIVLVALLGVGVAEHTGFINAGLRQLLGTRSVSFGKLSLGVVSVAVVVGALELYRRISRAPAEAGLGEVVAPFALLFFAWLVGALLLVGLLVLAVRVLGLTSERLLTPLLVFIAIVSHTAADAGYVVVIPLGAVIFYAAGRHPLAGLAAAFAGVSGGFSANFIPSAIDPLLQGITQESGRVLDPELLVNPLCNWFFMSASSLLVIAVAWWLTDKVIEPRLMRETPVDGDMSEMPAMEPLSPKEASGLRWGYVSVAVSLVLLTLAVIPEGSPLRDPATGEIASFGAPLMLSIVPLIFILFLIPGVIYGYVAGTIKTHKDIVAGMTKGMESMAYYIVMAFFAAQFIAAFRESGLGILLAVSGAEGLQALQLPPQLTIVGIIILTGVVNLFVGSASAKWLIIAPIFVPMLMQLGFSPELTQAAYRVGDSTSNIITPLLPYFPLIVVFARRYFTGAGIGTLVSMMLPYAVTLFVTWTLFLLAYWALGIPLGIQAGYTYPP